MDRKMKIQFSQISFDIGKKRFTALLASQIMEEKLIRIDKLGLVTGAEDLLPEGAENILYVTEVFIESPMVHFVYVSSEGFPL